MLQPETHPMMNLPLVHIRALLIVIPRSQSDSKMSLCDLVMGISALFSELDHLSQLTKKSLCGVEVYLSN